jgi:hypothetical protein
MIGPDKIFSYWVFGWYIIYMFQIIQISPKLALIIGLIENIILLGLIFNRTSIDLIIYFCITIVITKIIPIFTLWSITIGKDDWKYLVGLGVVYLLWIYFTGYLDVYFKIFSEFVKGNPSQLPGVMFVKMIIDKIENIR